MSLNNDVKLDNYDYFEVFWRKEYTCSYRLTGRHWVTI